MEGWQCHRARLMGRGKLNGHFPLSANLEMEQIWDMCIFCQSVIPVLTIPNPICSSPPFICQDAVRFLVIKLYQTISTRCIRMEGSIAFPK